MKITNNKCPFEQITHCSLPSFEFVVNNILVFTYQNEDEYVQAYYFQIENNVVFKLSLIRLPLHKCRR